MSVPARKDLERVRYGQQGSLLSRDFREQARTDEQLRWWHNRSVHQSFGISSGFAAEFVPGSVPLRVRIGSGLAYDSFGREVLSAAAQSVMAPETSGEAKWLLLVRADADPAFCWKAEQTFEVAGGVPVSAITAVTLPSLPDGAAIPDALAGRCTFDAARGVLLWLGAMSRPDRETLTGLSDDTLFTAAVDALFRRSQGPDLGKSRSISRPRIANGATRPGNTAWELWADSVNGQGRALGFQVRIDTSAAGFTEVPCYFAWIPQGQIAFDHLEELHLDSFILRFWIPGLPRILRGGASPLLIGQLLSLIRNSGWYVCWLGIQHEDRKGR